MRTSRVEKRVEWIYRRRRDIGGNGSVPIDLTSTGPDFRKRVAVWRAQRVAKVGDRTLNGSDVWSSRLEYSGSNEICD